MQITVTIRLLALATMLVVAAQASGAGSGRVSPARAMRICAAAGPFWPTETLAPSGRTAWIACKEQSKLIRLDLASGRKSGTVRLDAPVTAVATGAGWVWALDGDSTLYRIDAARARLTKRIGLPASAAYNIWIGGGSVWAADDQGARVLRISPATGRVVARIGVGDGPADMAFAGKRAWVIDHRDRTLFRIDMATNRATRLGTVGTAEDAASERLAMLGGSLWVTGRGMPLLQLDPETGATRRSIDVNGTGIDVIPAAGDLWVPVRTAAVDRSGLPTMTALRRVTPGGTVTTAATASGRVDVHGLAAARGAVWLADNTSGFLYRIAP
jgi:virginiamycin B lyase